MASWNAVGVIGRAFKLQQVDSKVQDDPVPIIGAEPNCRPVRDAPNPVILASPIIGIQVAMDLRIAPNAPIIGTARGILYAEHSLTGWSTVTSGSPSVTSASPRFS